MKRFYDVGDKAGVRKLEHHSLVYVILRDSWMNQ